MAGISRTPTSGRPAAPVLDSNPQPSPTAQVTTQLPPASSDKLHTLKKKTSMEYQLREDYEIRQEEDEMRQYASNMANDIRQIYSAMPQKQCRMISPYIHMPEGSLLPPILRDEGLSRSKWLEALEEVRTSERKTFGEGLPEEEKEKIKQKINGWTDKVKSIAEGFSTIRDNLKKGLISAALNGEDLTKVKREKLDEIEKQGDRLMTMAKALSKAHIHKCKEGNELLETLTASVVAAAKMRREMWGMKVGTPNETREGLMSKRIAIENARKKKMSSQDIGRLVNIYKDSARLNLPKVLPEMWAFVKADYDELLLHAQYPEQAWEEKTPAQHKKQLNNLVAIYSQIKILSAAEHEDIPLEGTKDTVLAIVQPAKEIDATVSKAQEGIPADFNSENPCWFSRFLENLDVIEEAGVTVYDGIATVLQDDALTQNKVRSERKTFESLSSMAKEADRVATAHEDMHRLLAGAIGIGFLDEDRDARPMAKKFLHVLELQALALRVAAFCGKTYAPYLPPAQPRQEQPATDTGVKPSSDIADASGVSSQSISKKKSKARKSQAKNAKAKPSEAPESEAQAKPQPSTSVVPQKTTVELNQEIDTLDAEARAAERAAKAATRLHMVSFTREEAPKIVDTRYAEAIAKIEEALDLMGNRPSTGKYDRNDLEQRLVEYQKLREQYSKVYEKFFASPASLPIAALTDEIIEQGLKEGKIEAGFPTDKCPVRKTGKYKQHMPEFFFRWKPTVLNDDKPEEGPKVESEIHYGHLHPTGEDSPFPEFNHMTEENVMGHGKSEEDRTVSYHLVPSEKKEGEQVVKWVERNTQLSVKILLKLFSLARQKEEQKTGKQINTVADLRRGYYKLVSQRQWQFPGLAEIGKVAPQNISEATVAQ